MAEMQHVVTQAEADARLACDVCAERFEKGDKLVQTELRALQALRITICRWCIARLNTLAQRTDL